MTSDLSPNKYKYVYGICETGGGGEKDDPHKSQTTEFTKYLISRDFKKNVGGPGSVGWTVVQTPRGCGFDS